METKTIVVPVGQDGLRNRALYVAQLALKLQRNRIDLFDLVVHGAVHGADAGCCTIWEVVSDW